MTCHFSNSFQLGATVSAVILLSSLPVFVDGIGEGLPWARITATPEAATWSLDGRDYDTANSHLYGYTSVGMDGMSIIWSVKSCDDIAPIMLIEIFHNTVFGLCWAVSTAYILGYPTTASGDYITACSGQIAIGTSTIWDCSTLGNCIFNTIYPDLASTSLTLGATCAQITAGYTYFHATTSPTDREAISSPTTALEPTASSNPPATSGPTSTLGLAGTSGSAPTNPSSSSGTSGGGASGLSTGDIIALAVGIPTILLMLCTWLFPCLPWSVWRRRGRRRQLMANNITNKSSSDDGSAEAN